MSGTNARLLLIMCPAVLLGCSIKGTVTADGSGLANVPVRLEGAQGATTTTNASGHYRFERLTGGSYKVTPSSPGYEMTPRSRHVRIDRPFQVVSGVDFTASRLLPVVAPVLGNITVTDMAVDGVWDSVNTANLLEVRHTRTSYSSPHVTRRVVFEFDLASVSRTVPVRSAVLDFAVRSWGGGSTSGTQLDFYGYKGDGTLNLADAVAGDSLVGSTLITTSRHQIDLRAFIQSVLDSGSVIAGLSIRSHSESVTSNVDEHCYIEGRLSTSATFPPPRLTIALLMKVAAIAERIDPATSYNEPSR